MSMRDYAVDDYGIVFSDKEFKFLSNKSDISETWEIADQLGLEIIGEFTGEAFIIDETGQNRYDLPTLSYNSEEIIYAPLITNRTLFKAAYSSMEELIVSLKSIWGEYLPENYDYPNSIRHIVGTYYG